MAAIIHPSKLEARPYCRSGLGRDHPTVEAALAAIIQPSKRPWPRSSNRRSGLGRDHPSVEAALAAITLRIGDHMPSRIIYALNIRVGGKGGIVGKIPHKARPKHRGLAGKAALSGKSPKKPSGNKPTHRGQARSYEKLDARPYCRSGLGRDHPPVEAGGPPLL